MTSILHTVNKSPFNNHSLAQCLQKVGDNDSVLLLEDGVYGALKNNHSLNNKDIQCYAIKDDINARGLQEEQLNSGITLIDYNTFVELTTKHALVQSWY